jgi:ADP-heptose:LPS heptosyltransferase
LSSPRRRRRHGRRGTVTARPRLVVLRALGLGDFLTAVPALRALTQAYPSHRRLLAAPAALAPLAAVLHGVIDAVVDTDFRQRFSALPPSLCAADVAVNLHGCGPQSHRTLLAAEPGALLAFRHLEVARSDGGPQWREDEHEVMRWCRCLRFYGIQADPSRLYLDVPTCGVPMGARGATLIHPGAASPARRWPAERWAAVARAEHAAGRPVIITGGSGEVGLARQVATSAGLDADVVMAGRTGLVELAALVAVASRVVCGDTGVAHLATATRTPSVILFGPTDPAYWGPSIDHRLHRTLWAGRTGDPHAQRSDPGLLRIGIDDVLDALADLDLPS